MKYILSFCLMIAILDAHATSVHCDWDENFQSNSSKIKIEYIWDSETWAVLVKSPEIIDSKKFSRALAVKGDDGQVFTFPLEATIKEGVVESHFYGNDSTLIGMRVVLWYDAGAPCHKVIELPIKHNKRL